MLQFKLCMKARATCLGEASSPGCSSRFLRMKATTASSHGTFLHNVPANQYACRRSGEGFPGHNRDRYESVPGTIDTLAINAAGPRYLNDYKMRTNPSAPTV